MRYKRVFSLTLGLVFAASAAFAETPSNVTCVQNQMIALEFDPGPVDGAIGRKTRAAADAWLETQDEQHKTKFLPLYAQTALQWCREIGELNSDLRRFWPSQQRVITFTDTPDAELKRKLLERSIRQVRDFYDREFDIRLASRLDLVGAANITNLRRLVQQAARPHRNATINYSQDPNRCEGKAARGTSWPNLIAVCWPSHSKPNQTWLDTGGDFTHSLLAHEFIHIMQYELANDIPHRFERSGKTWLVGPTWLQEGSAEYFEDAFHVGELGAKPYSERKYFDWIHSSKLTLATLRNELSSYEAYNVAHAAAYVLARRHGEQSLVEYWRNLAVYETQSAAFEATFRMTFAEFEDDFRTISSHYRSYQSYIRNSD